ncbi:MULTISPECIES: SymE family type I addiction module toxin [Klebsiella]|uniref:SymE family type I addiction module toxin n=1 Tax=Klebsiella TaxID=570 RepID=UPI0009B98E81|nr:MULTISPECIES: SymE family type I addiction module toxin [Klebsiella]EKU6607655.1 SymE family type I addiction module toxin [Klebsiella aerogenes]EKU8181105.1 SymE family type I addiction module toxin [Klebsiella aerogenes]EKW5855587.1 SymE family type I addiction module toxin [Klebsiella aerogenes]EKZ5851655.1 SymE family type I addiction module toxin [Klebsiella aerogenes]EKZ6546924.1 SymE family type I addiction module toxin [Klebsiella aerogenes]
MCLQSHHRLSVDRHLHLQSRLSASGLCQRSYPCSASYSQQQLCPLRSLPPQQHFPCTLSRLQHIFPVHSVEPDATPRYAVLLPVSHFSPKLLKSLSYKITYYSRGLRQRLRLNDKWLAEAGFCTDSLVSVPVEHGQLVIRPATKWLIKVKILPNYGRNFYYTLMKATF